MAGAVRAETLRRRTAAGRLPTPVERPTTLYLGESALVTLQTTPVWLEDWAAGFLYTEGVIQGPGDITGITVDDAVCAVRVEAQRAPGWDAALARRRYLTSGCGKGVTFSSLRDAMSLRPVSSDLKASPGDLLGLMARMQAQAHLYAATGGIHAAAVADLASGDIVVREDIGRHNALDKAIGAALRRGWRPGRTVVLTSGRISYEMCAKIARFGAPLGASLTAATDMAARLAARLGIALVGYVRSKAVAVYTGSERIMAEA